MKRTPHTINEKMKKQILSSYDIICEGNSLNGDSSWKNSNSQRDHLGAITD